MIKTAVFVLSVWGHLFFVHRKLKAEKHFVPIITAAFQGLILYAGALCAVLEETARVLCAAGLAGFLWFIILLRKGKIRRPAWELPDICFWSGVILFAMLILRLRLIHYDNFSHWALAAKYILSTDRLPGMGTELVVFPDYPPGSSLIIYYVCKFLGRSQGVMLLAFNSLIFSCFYAVFGIVEEKRRFLLYSFLAMGCSVLSYLNLMIRINNLLVDFLLPALAMAAIAATCRHRDKLWQMAAWNMLILGYTGIVKNTGIFFAAFAGIFALWSMMRAQGYSGRQKAAAGLMMCAGTALSFAGWQYYVNTALAGYESKFALDAAGEGGSYLSVQPEQYGEIIGLFTRTAFDLSGRAAQVFLLCNILAVAAVIFVRLCLKRRWRLFRVLLLADGMTALYYGGILFLYLYSMPADEALRLAGFERYACSIMVLFAGSLVMCAALDIEHSFAVDIDAAGAYRAYSSPAAKRYYQYGVLFTFVVAANFLYSEYNGLSAIQKGYPDSLPGRIVQLTGDRWYEGGQEDGRRYLVAASDEQGEVSDGEVRYISRYFLYAPNVDVTDRLDAGKIKAAAGIYDFIIVLDPKTVDGTLSETCGQYLEEPGLYDAKKLSDML